MDRNCQNCDKPVEESWTLCKACRRGYARLLHRLRVNLYRLQSVARREYRLTEPGNGGRPQGGDAPAPVDLHAVDLLDQTEQAIEQACADAGTWLGRWQWLAKRAPVILPLLCRRRTPDGTCGASPGRASESSGSSTACHARVGSSACAPNADAKSSPRKARR